MKLSNLFFLSTLASFLPSCAVGPDYTPPKSPDVASYTHKKIPSKIGAQQLVPSQSISPVWWNEFNSPTLNQIMQKGIHHSYTLVSMKETLKEAQETLNADKGALWPQVSAGTSVGRQKYGVSLFGDSGFSIAPFTYYTIGSGVNWTLDIFGKTRRTIEQQQAMVEYQKRELEAAFLTLTGNITTTTLAMAELHDQIDSIQKIISDDKKNLALVEKAFLLGAGTKVNVLTAQSQLDTDETLLPPTQQQLNETRNELNALVGALPSNWQAPVLGLKHFNLPKTLPLNIPSELVHNRPDILAAEALLHAASANIGIATANLYPQISLSAATAQEALTPHNLFNASSNAWNLLGNLTNPIFTGGTLQAERRAAIHAYKATYANYQHVVIKAFVQVSNVLSALQQDEQSIIQTKKALDTTQKSLNLARESFQVGSGDFLTIIEVERLYNQAQLSYVKALGQQYQDTTQLYLVLGGGIYNKGKKVVIT